MYRKKICIKLPQHFLNLFFPWRNLKKRFGCVWDRRNEENVGLDERLKPYVMRYFLVDDTIQITDAEFESNQKRGLYSSNRAQEAVLLRRQRLPKGCFFRGVLLVFILFFGWPMNYSSIKSVLLYGVCLQSLGDATNRMNVFSIAEPRPIMTSPADAADITFYDPQDLMLANVISVHGRR